MTMPHDPQQTCARLERAVDAHLLYGDMRTAAQRLLAHLHKPAQITVMGPSGAGKSSLINMLLGGAHSVALRSVPLFELRHGHSETTRIETRDGGVTTYHGGAAQVDLPEDVLRVEQTLPASQLLGRTLVEVALPQDPTLRAEVIDRVIATTDFSLWCSQVFSPAEANVWARMPDCVKDHSFLVLTKADKLQMQGNLHTQTTRFEETLAEEFLALYPVATKQAIAALGGGLECENTLWAASGGKALCDGIAHQITTAQQADLDYADMLLASVPQMQDIPAPAVADQATPVRHVTQQADPKSTGIAPMQRCEAVETALALLQDCANVMTLDARGMPQPAEMLAHSAQAAQALATLFMDAGAEDPRINAVREDVLESEQVIMLLQLEGTTAAAGDAVTTLLQLKKEMAEVACA
ncbi:MAG: hypothetical protein V2I76_04085 [Roseobacter sp.]|jgi:hypothetical protein|nr:hypothetical protein [Roseobacter sp.]